MYGDCANRAIQRAIGDTFRNMRYYSLEEGVQKLAEAKAHWKVLMVSGLFTKRQNYWIWTALDYQLEKLLERSGYISQYKHKAQREIK